MLVGPSPVTLSATISGPNVLLSFPTQAGFNYTVTYKNNLTDAVWTPLGSAVPGDGTIKSVSDTVTPHAARYYQLSIQ
jgi:hypothetical protein